MDCGGQNQAVFRLCNDCTFVTFCDKLGVQWTYTTHSVMVDTQPGRSDPDDCTGRVSVHEIGNQSHSSWTWTESRLVISVGTKSG